MCAENRISLTPGCNRLNARMIETTLLRTPNLALAMTRTMDGIIFGQFDSSCSDEPKMIPSRKSIGNEKTWSHRRHGFGHSADLK